MTDPSAAGERLTARVAGRVQGVGFRAFVRERARRLGLAGWVRNERDGTVRVVAEGPRADLDALVQALHQGPPASRVSEVDTTFSSAEGEMDGFGVRF